MPTMGEGATRDRRDRQELDTRGRSEGDVWKGRLRGNQFIGPTCGGIRAH